VLVAGSGPTDRNGNHPPLLWTGLLKQTAEILADAGIASLRYDKRGLRRSGGRPKDPAELARFAAWENFSADVVAAHRTLCAQPEVDAGRVALLGHSEGGLLVMHAALAMQEAGQAPAAIVLVSTPGRPIDVVLREQLGASMRRLGVSAKGTAALLERNEAIIASIRDRAVIPDDVPPELAPLYPRYIGPFLRSQLKSDPAELAARLAGPVLVIQGEKDLQVSADRDAPALEAALERRPGRPPSLLVILPSASHNLKKVEREGEHAFYGPAVPEYREQLVPWLGEVLRADKR
jgi:pimeloyl-ACP methyl ester carboxylesterase